MRRSRVLDMPRLSGNPDLDDPLFRETVSRAAHTGMLSSSETRRLLHRVTQGDRLARERLVEHNMLLVISVAIRYSGRGVPLMDLVQEGSIGLMHAIDLFDMSQNTELSTYATWWIRQNVSKLIKMIGRQIREPIYVIDARTRVGRAIQQLDMAGIPVSDETLAAITELPLEHVRTARVPRADVVSIDASVNGGRSRYRHADEHKPLSELVSTDEPTVEKVVTDRMERETLMAAFRHALDRRELLLLGLRYGLDGNGEGLSLRAVGERMAITYERVRQIETRALAKLRTVLLGTEALRELPTVVYWSTQPAGVPPPRPKPKRQSKRPAVVTGRQPVDDTSLKPTQLEPQSNNSALPASFDLLVGRAIRATSPENLNTISARNHNMRAPTRQKGTSKKRKSA